jgi:hypothetical protein
MPSASCLPSANCAFISGTEKLEVAQNSGAVSYQHYLGEGLLNGAEFNGYVADTASRNLADKTYAIDTASLYELWNDRRRVAGDQVIGLQGRLVLTPLTGSILKLGAGGERLEYDYLTGRQSTIRPTGSAEWNRQLMAGLNLKAGFDAAAAAAAAAPSVVAVQAGTSFAMTANVAATPGITGLAAATAYKVYFVAKDAVNNVQGAVQNVAVTTAALANTAPTLNSVTPTSIGGLIAMLGQDSYLYGSGDTITFTLAATDPEGTPVRIVVDGVVQSGNTYSYTISDTGVPHTFVIRGTDGALLTPTSKTITITGG